MDLAFNKGPRISPRLKNALVADLVLEQLGSDGDRWLIEPLRDEREWTEHLGRQLGIRTICGTGEIHETLLVVLLEIDALIMTWPPPHDVALCRALAHEATKHLSPSELLDTLLAGPPQWRRSKIEAGCRVDHLSNHLQPLLAKGIAAELSRLLGKWVEWDIRKLRERRRQAQEHAQSAARTDRTTAAPPRRVPYKRPTGRDRIDLLTPRFQPPGRT